MILALLANCAAAKKKNKWDGSINVDTSDLKAMSKNFETALAFQDELINAAAETDAKQEEREAAIQKVEAESAAFLGFAESVSKAFGTGADVALKRMLNVEKVARVHEASLAKQEAEHGARMQLIQDQAVHVQATAAAELYGAIQAASESSKAQLDALRRQSSAEEEEFGRWLKEDLHKNLLDALQASRLVPTLLHVSKEVVERIQGTELWLEDLSTKALDQQELINQVETRRMTHLAQVQNDVMKAQAEFSTELIAATRTVSRAEAEAKGSPIDPWRGSEFCISPGLGPFYNFGDTLLKWQGRIDAQVELIDTKTLETQHDMLIIQRAVTSEITRRFILEERAALRLRTIDGMRRPRGVMEQWERQMQVSADRHRTTMSRLRHERDMKTTSRHQGVG